ncbi:hypothetical protein D9M69_549420 [compost metagenome]
MTHQAQQRVFIRQRITPQFHPVPGHRLNQYRVGNPTDPVASQVERGEVRLIGDAYRTMADSGVSQVQHTQFIHPQYHGRYSQRVVTQIQHLQAHQLTKLRSCALLKLQKGGTQVERSEVGHLPNRWRQHTFQHAVCVEPPQVDTFQVQGTQVRKTFEKDAQALALDQVQAPHR